MNDLSWFSAILIGLAGSVHCAGMCGGIVTSFTFALPKNKSQWPYLIAYNSGRILSYSFAGAIAGLLGQIVTTKSFINPQALTLFGGVFMVLLGLYVGQWSKLLVKVEKVGAIFWRKISPISKRFIPFKHPIYAVPYGLIWGWLPCGLVYSTLTWSVSTGSVVQGAITMFCFGLGTLPIMLAMGASASQIRGWLTQPVVKRSVAVLLCLFGLILCYQGIHNW
ncbi:MULTISPECIES: sulfite exporter TauE/SafE family protein [Aliiglaciecola]|uniref:sulfite exporter TauE/SafE family protein n=1 Tax=Aliiglaciecola TaxID=1406885 RepID=UPI001C09EA7A|nr:MULTISPECIES: sulfite exporter TauE/SafE family protein [Aliiglaciecola]MBU2876355.1 sulfite exporter TauE/SafE family protein [Aliiglaciecola lipolytica]MDO6710571.1 sulfite exporter TauE/SafE family protein [Aliiglaciecola sp. 2_MG-2023]MDO6751564.1 sulfite exporter TauE/SafE family protein [Aliiglaciecola sp. 1_MG-2023]